MCACKSIANEKNFECTTLINKPVEVHGHHQQGEEVNGVILVVFLSKLTYLIGMAWATPIAL